MQSTQPLLAGVFKAVRRPAWLEAGEGGSEEREARVRALWVMARTLAFTVSEVGSHRESHMI